MTATTPCFRSEYARELRESCDGLLTRIAEVTTAEASGQVRREEDDAALRGSLREFLLVLHRGPNEATYAGDLHELQVVLQTTLGDAVTTDKGPLLELVDTLAGAWALTLGVRPFSQEWRSRTGRPEYESVLRAAGLFHGGKARWQGDEALELRMLALETMAGLMLELGYEPAIDLPKLDPDRPLNTTGVFTLVAFQEAHRRQRSKEGWAPSRDIALRDLAVVRGETRGAVDRALRLWCARDELTDGFVSDRWGWMYQVDLTGPLSDAERRAAPRTSRGAFENLAQLSRIPPEDAEGLSGLAPGVQPERFSAVSISCLGPPSVGKSSNWNAQFSGRPRNGGDPEVHVGRELIGAFDDGAEQWARGQPSETAEFEPKTLEYRPRPHLPELPVASFDFPGEQFAPQVFSAELRSRVLRSRGLIFFVDERSLGGGVECRDEAAKLSRWISALLRYHDAHNVCGAALPVAFCLHKIDLEEMLGEEAAQIPRYRVIGPDVRRELLHSPWSRQRVGDRGEDPGGVMERLEQAILQQPENNWSPRLQRLLRRFLDRFAEALSTALHQTSRVEIFLATSVPSRSGALVESPTQGARGPVRWMARQLYVPFLRSARKAALAAYERRVRELEDLQGEIKRFRRLSRIHGRLGQRQEQLEVQLTGRPWLRRAFRIGRQVDLVATERDRVTASMKETLERAAHPLGLEIAPSRPPFRPDLESLLGLIEPLRARRRELGRLAKDLQSAVNTTRTLKDEAR